MIKKLGTKQIPFALVFTKTDKLPQQKTQQHLKNYKKQLLESWDELPPIFLTSSFKKNGLQDILDYINKIVQIE